MKKSNIIIASALLSGCLLSSACIHQGALVEVPATLMQYQHQPTEAKLLALAKSYAQAINSNLEQQSLFPGQYADYGVALAKLGCRSQANVMFNNEKAMFPNSSLYVDMLKQTLVPELCNDNRFDTAKIDLKTLDTIAVTYTPEEEALLRQQAEDPEYNRLMKLQAQQERQQQADAKRKAKKAEQQARKEALEAQKKAKQEQQRAEREARKKAAATPDSASTQPTQPVNQ